MYHSGVPFVSETQLYTQAGTITDIKIIFKQQGQDVKWIYLAQDRVQHQALGNMAAPYEVWSLT